MSHCSGASAEAPSPAEASSAEASSAEASPEADGFCTGAASSEGSERAGEAPEDCVVPERAGSDVADGGEV